MYPDAESTRQSSLRLKYIMNIYINSKTMARKQIKKYAMLLSNLKGNYWVGGGGVQSHNRVTTNFH